MRQADAKGRCIKALKLLNNALTTKLLYPPGTPQVSAAGERAFKGLMDIISEDGQLEFSLLDGKPCLSCLLLTEEMLSTFSNLVIFRQLGLLGKPRLVMDSSLDSFSFEQILNVMSASSSLIENSGGGEKFILTLNLIRFFPPADADAAANCRIRSGEDKVVSIIRPDLIECALGRDKRQLLEKDLNKRLASVGFVIDLLHASTAQVLQTIRKAKNITATPEFSALMKRLDACLAGKNRASIIAKYSEYCSRKLNEQAIAAILAQDFSSTIGGEIYSATLQKMDRKRIGEVIRFYRKSAAKLESILPGHGLHLEQSLKTLLATDIGRSVFASEKAQRLLSIGEKTRRKKRIEAGVKRILSGEKDVLASEEMLQYLPLAIGKLGRGGRTGTAMALLEELCRTIDADSGKAQKHRTPQVQSLVALGELLLSTEEKEEDESRDEKLLVRTGEELSGPLLAEITEPGLFTGVIRLLYRIVYSHWEDSGRAAAGDALFAILCSVRAGGLQHSAALQEIVDNIQNELLTRRQFDRLLDLYLNSVDGEKEGNRLIMQGSTALRYLVDTIMQMEDGGYRDRLIKLGVRFGAGLSLYIQERIPGHMPWFAKRNLLKLLAQVGSEANVDDVMACFRHPDLRVQREAFLTLNTLGGRHRRSLFIKAIDHSTETVQLMLIKALGERGNREVALKMNEMLEDFDSIKEKCREDILLAVVETLSRCNCQEALDILNKLLERRYHRAWKRFSATVWAKVKKGVLQLQQDVKTIKEQGNIARKIAKNAMRQAARIGRSAKLEKPPQLMITGLPLEQTIHNVLRDGGRKEEALRLILELLGQVLHSGNFTQAKRLRQWMVHIDNTAVASIMKADDMIKEEHGRSVFTCHLDVWGDLYEGLSSEEVDEIFGSFSHRRYELGETVVSQGDKISALFFINSGRVRFFSMHEDHNKVVKILGPGKVFGLEIFSDVSVWTFSVEAMESADISILPYDSVLSWRNTFPGLDRRLKQFCDGLENEQSIAHPDHNRRLHERFLINGTVKVSFLDSEGWPLGLDYLLPGIDISRGGVSCCAATLEQKNLQPLPGQNVDFSFTLKTGETKNMKGAIVAVRFNRRAGNPTIHASFKELLDEKEVDILLETFGKRTEL
ncbi:cyclic nucleotide-binding domain-containing protein [Desulforhopalus vacuolatus]|uniref:cyclic nucleotide-binding domain-containing protein n=1 Tax=Desulforhopalus vacuolatus TaxID=40414 RepID=UPI0019636F4F|nr:cyclic nucleotide-binding domain-containing protein [Desulforhopalus vacuolatus]MBM9518728.1 cyclic nucleotide-binding domain-containing protein [Desulforhopalus vacuolatus]